MRTNYILIDHENLSPTSLGLLDRESFRIIVFVGARQPRVPLELVQSLQPWGERAKYLQVSGSAKNALDFHIAFYIGELSASESGAQFYIVSGDTGYDPLIAHLRTRKILVHRIESIAAGIDKPVSIQAKLDKTTETAAERLVRVTMRLQKPVSRPKSVKALKGTINGMYQKGLTEKELNSIIESLQGSGVLSVAGDVVTYEPLADIPF